MDTQTSEAPERSRQEGVRRFKILVSDPLAEEGLKILRETPGFIVDVRPKLAPEELKAIIGEYDALIIRSGTKVTADIIESASRLKVIGRAGVGLDNVDLKAATKKGIVAMNTPSGNTTSTAEHTMSLILALARNVPQACAALKQGRWDRSKYSGVELHGKTLGVVGLGRIGSTVARFAQVFGMKILGYDPYLSDEMAQKMSVDKVALDELLPRVDFLTLHIPKTAETTHLINDERLRKMKPTARLINCARGGIVDEAALADALREGRLAGAALDVFEREPLPPDSPLLQLENCVVTPHLGASTSEAQINVAVEIAECVRNALLGKGILNAVNFPSLDAETYQVLEPYIDLAHRIGRFVGQLVQGGLKEVKVSYTGETTRHQTSPMTMALMSGVLSPLLGDWINSVNALDVARERGIHIQEIQDHQEREFVNCVKVWVHTEKQELEVWGTLTSNLKPRIVRVEDVYVEAIPDGWLLFIHNNDRPGIVGWVGTVLAKHDINIAAITFGRDRPGGRAVSVVNLDSEPPSSVVDELASHHDVLLVKVLKI